MTVGLWLITAGIIALCPEPPGHDFSSHLATAEIARQLLADAPNFAGWYAFDALPLPYWLPTLLLTPLVALFGATAGQQIFLMGLALALPWSLGAVSRALGRPLSPLAAAVATLAVFNWAWWLGEVAFLVSVPVALLGFAAWLRLGTGRGAAVGFAIYTVAGYLAHIYGTAALLGMAGSVVLLALVGRAEVRRVQVLALAWPLAWFGVGAWLILAQHGTEANSGHIVFDLALWRLVDVAVLPFEFVGGPRWVALVPAAVVLVAAARTRRLDGRLALPAALFAALAWAGPAGMATPHGFEDIGRRFSIWAVLLGAAAVPALPRRWGLLSAAALGVFALAKLGHAGQVHWQHRAHAAQVAELLEAVPAGAKVVPVMRLEAPTPADYRVHRAVNQLVYRRGAYSPHVFARSGQQPLRHVGQGDHRRVDAPLVAEDWGRFDHALVQVAMGTPPLPALANGDMLRTKAGFRLYRLASKPATPASTASSTGP